MVERICFVEIRRNEDGLYEGIQSLETAVLRASLKANGIDSAVYAEKKLSSLNDAAEDIFLISEETIVLVVPENAVDVNRALAEKLLSYSRVKLYGIGACREGFPKEMHLLGENPAAELFSALTGRGREEMQNEPVSAYGHTCLLPREMTRCGIWIGRTKEEYAEKVVEEELRMLYDLYGERYVIPRETLVFQGRFLTEEEETENLVRLCIKKGAKGIHYSIPADIRALSCRYLDETYRNISFIITAHEDLRMHDADVLTQLMESGKIIGIELDFTRAEKKTFLGMILEKAIEKDIAFSLTLHGEGKRQALASWVLNRALEKTKRRYLSGYSEYADSRLGAYAEGERDGKIRHLLVENKKEQSLSPEEKNTLVGLNSYVIYEKQAADIQMQEICFDADGVAHKPAPAYQEFLAKAAEAHTAPSNLLQVAEGRILVNDLAYEEEFLQRRMTYSEAKKNMEFLREEREAGNRVYVRLSSKADYRLFREDADTFHKTRQIGGLPLAYAFLENACRFLGENQCSASRIPRMLCGNHGKISACENCGECYRKEKNAMSVIRHYHAENERKSIARNCYGCAAKERCARCFELPGFLQEAYCESIRNQSWISDYVCRSYYIGNTEDDRRELKQASAPRRLSISSQPSSAENVEKSNRVLREESLLYQPRGRMLAEGRLRSPGSSRVAKQEG